jgi:hypothetical protein
MTPRHVKKSSISIITREIQIKTTVRYYLIHIKMAFIKNKKGYQMLVRM